MQNNWLRLALISFAGLIIIIAILAFITPGSMMGNPNYNMMTQGQGQMNMVGMVGQSQGQMNMAGMAGGYIIIPVGNMSNMQQITNPNMLMGNGAASNGMQMMGGMGQNMGQNMPMMAGMSQNIPMNGNANMNQPMNMPMNSRGMSSSPTPTIIVVPIIQPQTNGASNGSGASMSSGGSGGSMSGGGGMMMM